MPRIHHVIAAALTAAALAGCQTPHARVASASSTAHDEEMLGRIATLAGDWQGQDENGNLAHTATFSVTSAGSAVREIMFPGQAHEMTNLYHMDGPNLVLTHYCAMGNQPRMIASAPEQTAEGTAYHFRFDSVSNRRSPDEQYMGNMTLTLLNDGTIREDWRAYDKDGKLSEPTVFDLSRMPTR